MVVVKDFDLNKSEGEWKNMNDYDVCGECKWHQHEDIDDGWICVNPDSEYCADWCDYDYTCDNWEKREYERNMEKC